MENNHKQNIHRLIQMIRLDLFLTISVLLFFPLIDSTGLFTKASIPRFSLIIFLILGLLGLSVLPQSLKTKWGERLSTFLKSTLGQFAPTALFIVISGLLISIPKQNIIFNLFPVLICVWLIGIQSLLLFSEKHKNAQKLLPATGNEKALAALALLSIYIFLAIPSRLPGIFDGAPWNTPVEFIFATTLIPISILIDWRIYSHKIVVAIIIILTITRIGIAVFIPETGLGIRSYQNRESFESDNWQKTYSSIFEQSYSDVMKSPYESMLEFPANWLTRQNLTVTPKPWVQITINGYGRLNPGENLIFGTQGLLDGEIILTDIVNGEKVNATILTAPMSDFGAIQSRAPNPDSFAITGNLIFKNDKSYQFAPIIVKQDNTTMSAFDGLNLWVSKSIFSISSTQILTTSWFVWLQNLAVVGLLMICLIKGSINATRRGEIKPLEIYLGFSSVFFLLFVTILWETFTLFFLENKLMEILQFSAIFFVLINSAIILTARLLSIIQSGSVKGFLLSTGLIILTLFILIYSGSLKQFTVFSTLDDAFEYQYFAHNIYIQRDFLLLETQPRAYKILFPYLVGLLHMLFGQSSAAQFFLNAWCSVLTAMLLIKIIQKTKVIAPISGMAGSLLVLLLLGNYFFLYFEFGMIEPIAVLFLISLYYFAQTKSTVGIIGSGITTLLLRMDYAGAVLASLILTSMPIYGSFQEACGQILVWLKSRWLQLAGQILVLFLPAVSIIAAYNIQASNYKLKDGDTTHKNIASILEGFLRVIIGGNFAEIKTQFLNMPVFTVATTIILISGTLLGLAALFWRFKILKYVDFRMSLVILLFLSVYVIVRPTGYPPRFSTPLLPISILILASFINQVWKNKHQHFEGEL